MKFKRVFSVLPMRSKSELSGFAEKVFHGEGSVGALGVEKGKLRDFIAAVAERYRNNPYHNYQHAVDTLYTMAWMLGLPCFRTSLPDFYKFTLLVASLVHDVEHPGNDNSWEIKTQSPLAQKYNNMSVIENHSLAVTRELLKQPQLNLFAGIAGGKEAQADQMLQDLILCTDFSWHRVFLDELTQGVSRKDFDPRGEEFLSLISRTLIKVADISNTSKPYRQAKVWGLRVMNEFWAQGRKEKELNLPLGPLNDPEKSDFFSAQAGFIKFAAWELFVLLNRLEQGAEAMLMQLQANQTKYERNAKLAAAESLK